MYSTGWRFRQLSVKENRSLDSCVFNRIEVKTAVCSTGHMLVWTAVYSIRCIDRQLCVKDDRSLDSCVFNRTEVKTAVCSSGQKFRQLCDQQDKS